MREGPKEPPLKKEREREKKGKNGGKCRSKGFCLSSVLYIEIWWLLTIVSPLLPLSRCLYPWGGSRGPTALRSWELPWEIGPHLTLQQRWPEQSAVCRAEASGTTSGPPNKQQQPWSWTSEEIQQQWLCNDVETTAKPELGYQSAAPWGEALSKVIRVSAYVSLFLMQAFPLRIRLMFFSVWGASNLAGSILRCAIGRWKYPNPTGPLIMYSTQITQSSIHLPHK